MEWLSERRGTNNNDLILDVSENHSDYSNVLKYHQEFSDYWLNGRAPRSGERGIVVTFMYILNRVRNNLFHGGKGFSVQSDVELLEQLTPVLKEVADECINV